MQNPRELRRRIRSISAMAQITRAMQMVAASKMRKAQQAAIAPRPFVLLLCRIQRAATTRSLAFTHPLLEVREVCRRAVILVAADKGLCGPLNTNLFRLAAQLDPETTVFITAGRKAAQFVARSGRRLAADFALGDSPTFAQARAIAGFARDMFLSRDVDEVQIVVTRFINTLSQEAIAVRYLPVGEVKGLKVPGMDAPIWPDDEAETLFEPDAASVVGYLLGHYLTLSVYFMLLNAKASEHSARMVSMKNATDSAEDLMDILITKELLEIAGGQAE